MRNDKHLAIKLRQQGKSYKVICKELGIPKSTLCEWFSKTEWSKNIKKELTRKANYITRNRFIKVVEKRTAMWEKWREAAREEARQEYTENIKNPLFLAGLMLYWGEGDSKLENAQLRLSNSNPKLIRIFALFVKSFLRFPENKVRGTMFLYPDLNETVCKKHWSSASGIPENQFYKTQILQGSHPTKRLSNGTFSITLASRQLKEKMFVWIDLFQKEFKDTEP